MNEKIKELITPESILSYSMACIRVKERLQFLMNENYVRLVIPSRGAYPFYTGALQSNHMTTFQMERLRFYHDFELLLLPFTADWGNTDLGNISIDSGKVRKFWSKILADYVKKESSPFTMYYEYFVEMVGQRYTINTNSLLPKEFSKSRIQDEKFIFIDTAKSGKAICEIIQSFQECNLIDYQIILITDNNGESIQSEYREKINTEIAKGKLFEIPVEIIFSEDSSPLMNSGISSVVFPSLIEHSFYEIKEFQNDGCIGGGLWFIDSISHLRDLNPRLNGVRGALLGSVHSGILQQEVHESKWFSEMIHMNVQGILDDSYDFNLFDQEFTKQLIYDRILHRKANLVEEVDVSSSHVVRINLEDAFRNNFIKDFKRLAKL